MILPIIPVLLFVQSIHSERIYFPDQLSSRHYSRFLEEPPARDIYFPDDDIFQPNGRNNPRFPPTPPQQVFKPATNGIPPQRPMNDPIQNNEVAPTAVVPLPASSSAGNPLLNDVIANGITRLGLQINNEQNKGQFGTTFEQDQPVVFSPVNIAEALALVLLGAAGRTFTEIANTLGFNRGGVDITSNSQSVHEQFGRMLQNFEAESAANSDNPKLIAASGIFVQNGFPIRREYTDVATRVYKSQVQNLDFARNGMAAKNYINNWVSSKTNGKIQNMMASPPPLSTKVILTTALYFKGAWEQPFIPEATSRRAFYPYGRANKTAVQVDMMGNYGKFRYYKDRTMLNCEILEMPYKGGTTSMYIVVPDKSDKTKLKQLEQQLTPENIERLIGQMKKRDAILVLPKMRLESTLELSSTLSDLGIHQLFNPSSANLGVLSSAGDGTVSIGNRFGSGDVERDYVKTNCSRIFELKNNYLSNCTDYLPKPVNNYTKVIYKRFGNQVGRRFARNYNSYHQRRFRRQAMLRSVDEIRNSIENNPSAPNPGLYADQILHKVFIDITETGTEAAAATDVTIARSGMLTVRLDHPFMFFIRHNPSKLNLFWGSVTIPTPYYT